MRIPPRAAALSLLAATQFVLVLDASIVNVALPSIGRDLGVAPEDRSWVVNAYILMFGGFLLLGGRVADYLGHRRVYAGGLILFAAASLAGALAQSGPWLAFARGLQGLGAALVSPAALTLLDTGAMVPMFFITLYTQDVLGYSAVQSGLAQLPLAATIAASATLAPRVVVRVGYKATLVVGLAVVAGGLWWFGAVSPDGSFPGDLLGPSLVVGIGAGAVWVSSMVAATSGAGPVTHPIRARSRLMSGRAAVTRAADAPGLPGVLARGPRRSRCPTSAA